MKVLTLLTTILLFYNVATEELFHLTCREFKSSSALAKLFYYTSWKQTFGGADYYFLTKNDNKGIKVSASNCSALDDQYFDPSRKTVFIIHGYRAHPKKDYIIDMTDKLFKTVSKIC